MVKLNLRWKVLAVSIQFTAYEKGAFSNLVEISTLQ
jgi:hypothetical protein